MALYVIGDTHLSGGVDKPMDIFGDIWKNSREKLAEGLSRLEDGDLLVICGDFSWGMTPEQALPDFLFLESFPGKKLLVKGNHDYWWCTASKMNAFFEAHGIKSISLLHNDFYRYEGRALCATRGWMPEGDEDGGKVYKREVIRLEISLKAAEKAAPDLPKICFLHYPPITTESEQRPFTELMEKYGVRRCFYGHLHGPGIKTAFFGSHGGVDYRLISADYLNFRPVFIE